MLKLPISVSQDSCLMKRKEAQSKYQGYLLNRKYFKNVGLLAI